jgi:hypothetical protein
MNKEIKKVNVEIFSWTCKICNKQIQGQTETQIEWNVSQHKRKHEGK